MAHTTPVHGLFQCPQHWGGCKALLVALEGQSLLARQTEIPGQLCHWSGPEQAVVFHKSLVHWACVQVWSQIVESLLLVMIIR